MNFMCHEKLTVDLGPCINFVVGENGSGKSAVLTAITLCLGGKASATNRGGSLKEMIKHGRDHASLVVRLKNQGHDAYQPDVYGDSIIVERHFSRSGAAGFKIKSASGRIISTKKSDVEEIVEFWCLQVDNPLNILSQDNARQFLNASSPAAKYKFFVQGVQLEQLDQDYRVLSMIYETNQAKFLQHQEKAQVQKKELDEATTLARTVEKNHELRARRRLYANQLAWGQVSAQEAEMLKCENNIMAAEASIAAAERFVEEKARALEEIEERRHRAVEARDIVAGELGDFEGRAETAEENYKRAKLALEELRIEERGLHLKLKQDREEVEKAKAKLQAEEQRQAELAGDVPQQKQEELEQARQREVEIKEELNESRAALPPLERTKAELRKELDKLGGLINGKRREIMSAESRLKELEQNGSSAMSGYETTMPALLKAIENDQGFRQKPVGPIGSHIRLKKAVWSPVLERTFGNGLNGFVVTSKRDQLRLSAMMDRLNVKQSTIFIGNRTPLNTSGREPDSQFDTILRVLDIDDDLIRNQLIINYHVEQTILVEKQAEAERIMIDGGAAPRNVSAALSLHPQKRSHGVRLTFRNGSITTSTVAPHGGPPRMKSDQRGQVAIHKETLAGLSQDLAELADQRRLNQQRSTQCDSDISSQKKKTLKLENSLRHVGADIDRIGEELDGFEHQGSRLEALRKDLEEAEKEMEHNGNQWGTMALQRPDLNKKAEEAKKKLDAVREQQRDYDSRLAKAEAKVKSLHDLAQIFSAEKAQESEKVQLAKMEKTRREQVRDHQATTVEQFTAQARDIAPERVEIPDGETYSSVEKKYESIGKQLEQRRRQVGADDKDIFDRKNTAQAAYNATVKEIKTIAITQEAMKQTILMRMDRWRKFQRHITARSRANFLYLLSERGFRGKLMIDHRSRTLNLNIEPDETRKSAVGRSTKTLSGGEKSFSSICMLLAIWEAMGSPLRCLDEFDVFMDNVNRAISTNMLVCICDTSSSCDACADCCLRSLLLDDLFPASTS
jgi:structural maintenance of chromosomes protein 6